MNNAVKKLLQSLGMLFIIGGIVFLLIHSFVVTGSSDESFARDVFGFPIPHPPIWVSYIPYLGFFIGIVFEFLSTHGLVGVVISGILFGIGGLLVGLAPKEEVTTEPSIPDDLPDVIKQELIGKSGAGQPGLFNDVEPATPSDENDEVVEILGVKLDPEHCPVLYRKAKEHPETLKKLVLSLARQPGGSVLNAIQCLESDLQHG